MNTIENMKSRRSTRAYLDRDVDNETIEKILEAARYAPSGVNTQPWHVAVVKGKTKQQLTDAIIAAREAGDKEHADYRYYPDSWQEPYKSRRKVCGLGLYKALEIGREDTEKQKQAWYNNYRFFGAPVGLIFYIDRNLNQGSWLDMGMFVQNVMLAARELELATCPQASLADYPDIVRETLSIDDDYAIVCGMSLGYADKDKPENSFELGREEVNNFTRWFD